MKKINHKVLFAAIFLLPLFLFGQTTPELKRVLRAGNDGGAKQIKNILNPSSAQDAATKSYVDALQTYVTNTFLAIPNTYTTVISATDTFFIRKTINGLYYKVPYSAISGVASISGVAPIVVNTNTITITNSAADGITKGAASFTANDFNASSGNISIDYTNGQAANGSTKGFLTAADWTTFNNKGTGTVTTESVATANGFAGTVASPTTTPVITIQTTVTGMLKGNGTAISAATAGTDYLVTEVDGSVTNEFQTVANTSDATSHTATLSNSGGSVKLVEGSGITLATTGTSLDGVATITNSSPNATHTGDATGATTLTLATVNSNVGSFSNANITVNGKGLITAASNGSGGSGGQWTATGSNIYNNNTNGNVGVGTAATSITSKLTVLDTSSLQPAASFSVNSQNNNFSKGVEINAEGATTTDALIVRAKSTVVGGINNGINIFTDANNAGINSALNIISSNGKYNYGTKIYASGGDSAVALSLAATGGDSENVALNITDGKFIYNDPTKGAGKVLTSDASGVATWQTGGGGGGDPTVTNDNSTNATMYPTWVTGTSGALPIKVSSTKMTFNPSKGWMGLNTASPLGALDISYNGYNSGFSSLNIGADVSATDLYTRTDATNKGGTISTPHYFNAEKPFCNVFGNSTNTNNYLYLGGGISTLNAATQIRMYVASTQTTTAGTLMGLWSTTGLGINTTSYNAMLEVAGSGTTSATFAGRFKNSANENFFELRNDKRLIYADGNQALGKVLTSDASGVATWQTASGGGVTSVTASTPIASSGGTTPNVSLTGIIPISNGGTNSSSAPTVNSLLVGNGTSWIPTTNIEVDNANASIILKGGGTNNDLLFRNNGVASNAAIGQFYPNNGSNVSCMFSLCPKGLGSTGVSTQFTFGVTDFIADNTNYSTLIQRTGVNGLSWTSYKVGTGSFYPFFFCTNGTFSPASSAFYIGTNNNIGINTDTPSSKLDVEGGVSIGASYSGTTAAPANGAIIEGKVGIGVSSPSANLHIAAATTSVTPTEIFSASTGNVGTIVGGGWTYDYGGEKLEFTTEDGWRHRLCSSANGTITVTSPLGTPTISVSGGSSELVGQITFAANTSPVTDGTILSVTFEHSYHLVPEVFLQATNSAGALTLVYVVATNSGFDIKSAGNQTFTPAWTEIRGWAYHVKN